ncbi:hypothetical protein [Bradyrhizobium sp. F1.4.3]|uniref:hypothetical protein n=1 Tax=Bradyrhizobium sp. F1.4.3 TaxID=3156356 RepID=UPI0033962420
MTEIEAYSGGFNLPLVPATSGGNARGPVAIRLVSICPHLLHWKVLSSKPLASATTLVLIIRI